MQFLLQTDNFAKFTHTTDLASLPRESRSFFATELLCRGKRAVRNSDLQGFKTSPDLGLLEGNNLRNRLAFPEIKDKRIHLRQGVASCGPMQTPIVRPGQRCQPGIMEIGPRVDVPSPRLFRRGQSSSAEPSQLLCLLDGVLVAG